MKNKEFVHFKIYKNRNPKQNGQIDKIISFIYYKLYWNNQIFYIKIICITQTPQLVKKKRLIYQYIYI